MFSGKKRKLVEFDEIKLKKQLEGDEPGEWKRVTIKKVFNLAGKSDVEIYFQELYMLKDEKLEPTGFVRCENPACQRNKAKNAKNVSFLS